VGTVSAQDCEHYRAQSAYAAVGMLPEAEHVGLRAHLEGCLYCRDDSAELDQISALLVRADPDHLERPEMPPSLAPAVLGRLHAEARRERTARLWRRGVLLAAAAAVVALALALSLVGVPGGSSTGRTFSLTGEPGVHATVRLNSEAWGTSLVIDETGQVRGQVLWVSMRTRSGSWWEAGTYRSVAGRSVQVDLACALPMSEITSVWVRDSAGHFVLHAYVS